MGAGMKIFVDDLREPPSLDWIICRNSDSAMLLIEVIENSGFSIDEISLDHDLGEEDNTRCIVNHFCEYNWWPNYVYVHTGNPVAREWLEGTINRYAPEGTLKKGY